MATTARFGLQSFGGRVPGSFRDAGYAYTLSDRQVIDSLLAALEGHTHDGGEGRLLDPAPPTIATTVDPLGNLTGGRTYYYKVGYLDEWGLETAASDEVSITLPPGPATPSPPTLTLGTGGSLGNGGYYYAIAVYVGDSTRQTLASQTAYVNLTGTFNQVTITFPVAEASADGWVIYRKGPQETQLYCLAEVAKASTTYVDNGAIVADCTKTPATTDTTATNNVVSVTIGVADQTPVTLEVGTLILDGGVLAAGTYDYRLRPSVTIGGTLVYGAVTDVTAVAPLSNSIVQFTVEYHGGEFTGATTPPSITVELFGRTTASYKLLSTGTIAAETTTVVMTDNGSSAGTTTYAAITPTWIAPLPAVASWRLYRTNNSGNYPSGSLVKHVVETEAADSGGNLVRSWTDTGQLLQAGAPRGQSSTFQPPGSLSLNTQAETCLYTPPSGAPFPGPSVDTALDGIAVLLAHKWTKTYTFLAATGPLVGTARYYPGNTFKVLSVRASLSNAMTVSYDVKVDGISLWGAAQSVTAVGVTQAAITPGTTYAATSYLTVDLTSGTVPAGQALVIHIDLANVG
jgi:hypothetical protein